MPKYIQLILLRADATILQNSIRKKCSSYISCLNLILRSIENLRLIFSMGILLNRSSLTIGMIPKNGGRSDRKSTRLNSSHVSISYAVFCLKKKTDDDTNMNCL